MKLRDFVRFSFELVLPEKAIQALDRRVAVAPIELGDLPAQPHGTTFGALRQIIEDIDTQRHGGLTFGPETIERMTIALDGAMAGAPYQIDIGQIRVLAEKILSIAADGVRDPERLKAMALGALEKETEPQMPSMPTEDALSQVTS